MPKYPTEKFVVIIGGVGMLKIGILGGADIAFRMFIPAIKEEKDIKCVGVASRTKAKRDRFAVNYRVPVYKTYNEILKNPIVDIVYIPLPPALHYRWAKKALDYNKHVFLEKPSTTSYKESKDLVELASAKGLALQENYMFQYHSQLRYIKKLLRNNRIGKIHLIKSSFGFPMRSENDFRYNKNLGGGALLDAGGYVVKLATLMLGNTIKITSAVSNLSEIFGVDIFGSVSFVNSAGLVCQGSFGIDCHYQCNLEIWGGKGKLFTNRIFTAPSGYEPAITIEDANGAKTIKLAADKHFLHSIERFVLAVTDDNIREKMYADLLLQAQLVDKIKSAGKNIK